MPDWASIFHSESPILEQVVRGTVLYFGVLVLMRLMPRRSAGELAPIDLVFVILIAEAASHAMGDYTSVTDGLVLVSVLVGWNVAVNVLSYWVPAIGRLVSAPPLQIVRDGTIIRRNLRREFITENELEDSLREHGIDDVRRVKSAFVEGSGKITAICK